LYTLGKEVTVGHRAVLHSATVNDGALIGIGAIALNGAVVGQEALVRADPQEKYRVCSDSDDDHRALASL
jgi:carbonic anhydrase/acetyltransferase-like protein (isoleucine patch superfamily)